MVFLAGGLGNGKRGVARRGRRPQQRAEDRAGAGGRFASADTIVPDVTNPQQYNRYTYSLNSPMTHT